MVTITRLTTTVPFNFIKDGKHEGIVKYTYLCFLLLIPFLGRQEILVSKIKNFISEVTISFRSNL